METELLNNLEHQILKGYKTREAVYVQRVRKIAKSEYLLRHVCLSVQMEQLGSHWTDCHET
jgi:hypothetical protein